jgi:hypothetical protein
MISTADGFNYLKLVLFYLFKFKNEGWSSCGRSTMKILENIAIWWSISILFISPPQRMTKK